MLTKESSAFSGFSTSINEVVPEWAESIRLDVELITPELAEAYLEKNVDNYRKVVTANLAKFVDDMNNDRWKFSHQAIAFTTSDHLIDGQHRLMAVIKSGKPQWFLVVRGMPDDQVSNAVIDLGTPRNAGQILSRSGGMSNANLLASVVRCLERLRRGDYRHRGTSPLSIPSIMEICIAFPGISECVCKVANITKDINPTAMACWYLLAREENEADANECLEILAGRTEATNRHAFSVLREACLTRATHRNMGSLYQAMQWELAVAAWERRHEDVKKLVPYKGVPAKWMPILEVVFSTTSQE